MVAQPQQTPMTVGLGGVLASAGIAATKRPFIRATEIWVPTADDKQLELGSGLYGPLSAFQAVSEQTRFGYDEGLPGKAWASRHPIVLRNLTSSYFKRGDAAAAAGLTCAVALPIFSGERLKAVIVLFCGDDREHIGAIEVWRTPPHSNEMGLVDGYYGTADSLEWTSRHIKFMLGIGLPGRVWDTGMPVIMEDLGRARRFLRWEDAERVGINHGVGIPCGTDATGTWVLTFLSALGTPIAHRFEAWVPDANSRGLVFRAGYCELVDDLASVYGGAVLPLDSGTLASVFNSGVPAFCTDFAKEPRVIADGVSGTGITTMVAMPVIAEGAVRALVAWYL